MADKTTTGNTEPTPVPFIDLQAQYKTIAAETQAVVKEVLESQHFILGDRVSEFEQHVARYCDSREAIGCASGTDALMLALQALDIQPGQEVITTPFTFFATASSIVRTGGKPVFVDIDPATYNMDSHQAEAAITSKTKAIMPVHLYGQCADMEPLWRASVRTGVAIVEDACQAIGAEYRGRRAGVLGTMGCFSFFPTKNLGGAGDGGLLTTDDAELAKRLRRLRVHGDIGQYTHIEVGLNSRLDALQAAILQVKLARLDQWTTARQENAKLYETLFRDHKLLDAIELPVCKADQRHVYNQYVVRVRGGKRDDVLKSLRAQQIGANIYYPIPLHLQKCFANLGYKPGDFPQAEKACQEALALPIFAELTDAQQELVVKGIAKALGRMPVGQALPAKGKKAA